SVTLGVLVLSVITLSGCADLAVRDPSSLLVPRFQRSEILGFVAGFGTTFAAVPDLVAMLKRRSSAGINPRMAGIMGVFQMVWVSYGLLILSRPVIAWNTVAVVINFLNVGYSISASMHVDFRAMPHESSSYSMGYDTYIEHCSDMLS